jgi:hypothetical protein
VANEYPESLFTLLANEYDLEVKESVTRLCPPNLCDGEFVDDPAADTAVEVEEPAAPEGALGDLLAEVRDVYRTMASPTEEAKVEAFDEAAFVVGGSAPTPDPDDGEIDEAVEEARRFGEEGTGADELLPTFGLGSVDGIVASIEENQGPTLHYAHVQLPHAPYHYLPSRQVYYEPVDAIEREMGEHTVGSRGADPAPVALAHQRMLLQTGYVDALVGDLVDRLKETGLYEDTIVVMTSDHGAGFLPGETIRALGNTEPLDEAVYGDVLYVPLIIKGPGMDEGQVSDDNAMIVDVVPTIAELIGVEIPWEVNGISLVSDRRSSEEKRFHLVTMESSNGRLTNPIGPAVSFDGREHQRAALDHHVGTLLRGDNPDFAFYDVHDAGELLGRPVADLESGESSGWSARVDERERWDAVDFAAPIPAHLRASIAGAPGEGSATIAVSVNGEVVAVASTYVNETDSHRLEAMLAPSSLREGENTLELWEVTGGEGARALRSIALE